MSLADGGSLLQHLILGLDSRTLDGRIQELADRPTLHV